VTFLEQYWWFILVSAGLALFVLPAVVPGFTTMSAVYVLAFVAFDILSLWRLRQLRLAREIGVTCPLCNEEQVSSLLPPSTRASPKSTVV
jgi:hypothetical protein